MTATKPTLSFLQIVNMNVGIFGLQYAFALQAANMTPIYSFLGAEPGHLPYLWLAGPVTGLLVQPIIGAMSDKTVTRWGRRTPYFLIGAVISSICLLIMPFSSALWMAASLLWILDVGANTTLEPYRAFVSDKLNKPQHSLGYLTQTAFAGLGATLAFLTPTLLIWFGISSAAAGSNQIPITTVIAFIIGALVLLGSIIWSTTTTKEIPLNEREKERILNSPRGAKAIFVDISTAIREMPLPMKQMMPMMLCSWYGLFLFLQYMPLCLAESIYKDIELHESRLLSASLLWGQIGAFYNFASFCCAFYLVFLAGKYGVKPVHSGCLLLGGISLFYLPSISNPLLLYLPMLGFGICWASMLGNVYVMLASILSSTKTGIYMGIFNMFIVIPMIIQSLTVPLFYDAWLDASPLKAIQLAGLLFVLGALSVVVIRLTPAKENHFVGASGELT